MSDYIKHKEYKLPNGRTVTADFDEWGRAMVTIQAMDALFDIFNSSDVVEVVRCKDCRYWDNYNDVMVCMLSGGIKCIGDYCSYGERADT